MKYTIDIGRKIGENTFDFMFVNSFDDENKWNESIKSLSKALEDSNCNVKVTINEKEDFTKAYISFEWRK